MEVKVCDVIMGAGKTQSAITRMKEDTQSRYIFITPYLNEVDRIKDSCAGRDFVDPRNRGDGKLEDLHILLARKSNVASTHALFRTYTDETLRLIRDGGYKLILDEVFDTVEQLNIHEHDMDMLINEGLIRIEPSGRVLWLNDEYEGEFAETLKPAVMTGNVVFYNHKLVLWTFPVEVFAAFREVIILTYMFSAQFQKYYFDMNDVTVKRIGTVYKDGIYRFCENPNVPDYVRDLRKRMHILDDKKLNSVGDADTALSVSWYERDLYSKEKANIVQLQKNLNNVFKHRFPSNGGILWTTFKKYQKHLKGKGYTKGFLPYNTRATNAYRNCTKLAYCVNVFYNPFMKGYFESHGVNVKQDEYALSEMIQWIWRSAIRDGKDIWVYIPSRRMRGLLEKWLDEQACIADAPA